MSYLAVTVIIAEEQAISNTEHYGIVFRGAIDITGSPEDIIRVSSNEGVTSCRKIQIRIAEGPFFVSPHGMGGDEESLIGIR
jgi:hypothetical protein